MLASEFPCLAWKAEVNAPSRVQKGWAEVRRLCDSYTMTWKVYFEFGDGSSLFHALDYAIAYAALDMIKDEQTKKEWNRLYAKDRAEQATTD